MKINLNINPLCNWVKNYKRPFVIAGPCSAESEQQLFATAKELSKINYFRAGIWKPRTRPGSFEGVGVKGLKWMQSVKQETGLKTATEVANAGHVEACLKHGIDLLWVGARTTVNPFSVQEIADALKGVDIPVAVKNPIIPDLQLWIGAIERINSAGIDRIIAVHRGFSSYEKSPYRYPPFWEYPIELKTLFPDLPVICDPSHIAGSIKSIPYLAQKALDLEMDGLMLETHINPNAALSDKNQQLSPLELEKLLNTLIVREHHSENPEFKNLLEVMRSQIDELDEDITRKFASRMDIVDKIAKYKKDNNVTILQVKRWEEITIRRLSFARTIGINEEFMASLIRLIHKESIRRQTEIMNN